MLPAGQLRLSSSKIVLWKWVLGFGVGAACASAVVIAGDRVVPPTIVTAVAVGGPAIEATGTASLGGTPLTTAVLPAVSQTPPAPPALLPPEKPKSLVAKVHIPTKVAQFESCLPDCETRDPQVAGVEQPVPVAPPPPQMAILQPPAPIMPPPPLEPFDTSSPIPPPKGPVDLAVDTGQALFNSAAGASDAVVDGTRRALDRAVDLVW